MNIRLLAIVVAGATIGTSNAQDAASVARGRADAA